MEKKEGGGELGLRVENKKGKGKEGGRGKKRRVGEL